MYTRYNRIRASTFTPIILRGERIVPLAPHLRREELRIPKKAATALPEVSRRQLAVQKADALVAELLKIQIEQKSLVATPLVRTPHGKLCFYPVDSFEEFGNNDALASKRLEAQLGLRAVKLLALPEATLFSQAKGIACVREQNIPLSKRFIISCIPIPPSAPKEQTLQAPGAKFIVQIGQFVASSRGIEISRSDSFPVASLLPSALSDPANPVCTEYAGIRMHDTNFSLGYEEALQATWAGITPRSLWNALRNAGNPHVTKPVSKI